MVKLIALAILAFLIWAEVIPVRAWFFKAKAMLIGMFTRGLIGFLDILDELIDVK